MTKRQKYIFFGILIFAAFLIFFRLGRQDMLGDDAHYATRALGYFDYMSSAQQTTPVQWFGYRPWWSYLSFHDHPPLYFLIQHVFFRLFGDGVAVSRLTSALAALGSVAVMYFLARRLDGSTLGLLAMAALTLNNYFVWQGRIGLLESLFTFWLLFGLVYLLKGLQDNAKFFVWSGLFFALAMLTKYSFLFALPAIVIFLLLCERRVFRNKQFWLGVLVFFIIISPLFIYNFEMYRTRGHFDVQFADLFGQSNSDWPVLDSRVGDWNLDLAEPISTLGSGMSWPLFALALVSLPLLVFWLWRRQVPGTFWLFIFLFIFLTGFLIYAGGALRWMGVIAPFVSLLVAVVLWKFWRYRATLGAGIALAAYCLVYIFNTNHALAAPESNLWVSMLRKENLGYNQLDERLSAMLDKKLPNPAAAQFTQQFWYRGIRPEALDFPVLGPRAGQEFPYLVVYDAGMPWFPTSWIFDRQKVYRRFFLGDSSEFAALLTGENTRKIYDQYLSRLGVLFVKTSPTTAAKPDVKRQEIESLEKYYTDLNIEPEIIRDDKGREAFYIYDDLEKRR